MMKRNSILTVVVALLSISAIITGCARGEDDPWLTLHSRDARISQTWSLKSVSGSVVETTGTDITNIEYYFDGTNMYVTTNGTTESFAFVYDMEIKDDGEVFSQEFMNKIASGELIAESSQTSFWYWGDDDKNKTSVNLDLTGFLLSKYMSYDIPRLAFNDMTFDVDFSDNYTELQQINDSTYDYVAGSSTVSLELKWEVNLNGL